MKFVTRYSAFILLLTASIALAQSQAQTGSSPRWIAAIFTLSALGLFLLRRRPAGRRAVSFQ